VNDEQTTSSQPGAEAATTSAKAATPASTPIGSADQPTGAAARPAGRSLLSTVLEWALRRRAIASVTARIAAETAEIRSHRGRARLALELAEQARDPLQPFGVGPSHAVACELYREAIYWALRTQGPAGAGTLSFADAWAHADPNWLQAAGGTARLEELRELSSRTSFVDFGSLPPAEQKRQSNELARFAHGLLGQLRDPMEQLEALQSQRMWRVALPILAVGMLALVIVPRIGEWRAASRDLASGKPWRASSQWIKCQPEEERCEGFLGTRIFFHTADEPSPWLEIDLGKPTKISSVDVVNRSDCCAERAVPLVVEVGNDRSKFRQVARRDAVFDRWVAEFGATTARYVRLRIDGKASLHLERVRVYR
jgi:hypothetical protein